MNMSPLFVILQSRSTLHFIVFVSFAVSAALFVMNKATEAIAEIEVLENSPLFVPERHLGNKINNK